MYSTHASVVTVKPAGTRSAPSTRVISATFAPLPPSSSRMSLEPSEKSYTQRRCATAVSLLVQRWRHSIRAAALSSVAELEHELARVLAREQLHEHIAEVGHAAVDDLLARDQLPRAQPPGQLGRGLAVAGGEVEDDHPGHRGAVDQQRKVIGRASGLLRSEERRVG